MGKTKILMFFKLAVLWLVCCSFSSQNMQWQPATDGIQETNVHAVTIGSNGNIYAATGRAVYESAGGTAFKDVVIFDAGAHRTYSIYAEDGWVAAATDRGIWEADLISNQSERRDRPALTLREPSYSIFRSNDQMIAGTVKGVFRRRVGAKEWREDKGELANKPVFNIAGNDQAIFFAANDGIFLDKAGQPITKIFSVTGSADNEFDSDPDDIADSFDGRFIRDIAFENQSLFVVTKTGIWTSGDLGQRWERVNSDALPLADAADLEVVTCQTSHGQWASDFQDHEICSGPEPVLLLATSHGIFIYQNNRWTSLYKGLSTSMINDIAVSSNGDIAIATDQGVYRLVYQQKQSLNYQVEREKFSNEPTARDVQQMVIAYADVAKKKIDNWKTQARLKNFIPSFSLGLDRNSGKLYHWDTGANPDELQKGTDFTDWDISLKWDLANIIWSSDQTSIDSRAKLMVDQRQDLLDQATRIYFERRRLQLETASQPDTSSEKWQNELRIEELTAGLDALTGGAFSRNIK